MGSGALWARAAAACIIRNTATQYFAAMPRFYRIRTVLFRKYVFSTESQRHRPAVRADQPLLSPDWVLARRSVRVKQDAIPGIEQRLWFTPTKTGEWEIACSQLCGLGHYRMRGFYTIQTQADFNAWLASQPAGL